ncbi:MAG TPA: hypothetical protein VK571_09895 [Gemmatimonadaceae bacterium]|nr:hypothetical protein [Gemmatimonadaceae bacterium]
MAIRYPIAVLLAYLVFIGLVALWLRRYRLRARVRSQYGRPQVDLDVLDVPFDQLLSGAPETAPEITGFGGGGGFGGSGGGTAWGEGHATFTSAADASLANGASLDAHGDIGGGLDFDLGEGTIYVVPILIGVALALGGVIYVVFLAPVLFSELLLDAGLSAGLYQLLMREERRSWLTTAVRNTLIPAFIVAGSLAVAGAFMHMAYPDASSIGVVVKHLQRGDTTSARP